LGGVTAFRIPVARMDAKFKMSQNRNAASRASVKAVLRASGREEDRAVADWIEAHER